MKGHSHFQNFVVCVVLFSNFHILVVSGNNNSSSAVSNSSSIELDYIDPFKIKEEGCPMVPERHQLNITKLSGNWRIPFISLNWLADIGMVVYHNESTNYKKTQSLCPIVRLGPETDVSDWMVRIIFPKQNKLIDMRCSRRSEQTHSKFICFNFNELRDQYIMISATDHSSWALLVRCVPGEPDAPAEGMSWAILSRTKKIDPDLAEVLFSLLTGYGFDVPQFKARLPYNSCSSNEHH